MKYVLTILFALITNIAFAITPPDYSVRVFVFEDGGTKSLGSGVLIASNRVITNHHVVSDRKSDSDVKIMFSDWTVVDAKVLRTNKALDIALIEIPEQTIKPIQLGVVALPEDKVTTHGFGYGAPTTHKGVIVKQNIAIIGIKGAKVISGDSGGPIVNERGKLVGLVFGVDKEMAYGCSLACILIFLENE